MYCAVCTGLCCGWCRFVVLLLYITPVYTKHLLTHARTHSLTHSLTHSHTQSLTHSLVHSRTRSPTHSLTHFTLLLYQHPQALCHSLDSLQHLKLSHVAGLTDTAIARGLSHLTALTELCVLAPQNSAVSQASLAALAPLRDIRCGWWCHRKGGGKGSCVVEFGGLGYSERRGATGWWLCTSNVICVFLSRCVSASAFHLYNPVNMIMWRSNAVALTNQP